MKPLLKSLIVTAPLINFHIPESTVVGAEGLGASESNYTAPDYRKTGILGVQLQIGSSVRGITIHGRILSPRIIDAIFPDDDSGQVYAAGIPFGFLAEVPRVRFTRS